MEPYLYHGIKWNNVDLLKDILNSGYILSRRKLNNKIVDKNNIFNGDRYISLCQKTLIDNYMRCDYRIAYDDYIVNKPCIVLKNNNIKLIYPNLITMLDKDCMSSEEWHNIIFKNDENRYSYYMDELQVEDEVDLKENMIAVGLPISYIDFNYKENEKKELLDSIYNILEKKYPNIDIIDSSRYSFADNEEEIKKHILKR